MYTHTSQSGYSLVEVLIAITIFLMATVGPMTIAARAQQSAQYAREQNTAFLLAQEGIEAVIDIRNEAGIAHIKSGTGSPASSAWLTDARVSRCETVDGCGLYFNNNVVVARGQVCSDGCPIYFKTGTQRAQYTHDSTNATLTAYSRVVHVTPLTNVVKVTSQVTWQPPTSTAAKTITLVTYLSDIYNTN